MRVGVRVGVRARRRLLLGDGTVLVLVEELEQLDHLVRVRVSVRVRVRARVRFRVRVKVRVRVRVRVRVS